jgi:hypothetical protein
MGILLSCFVLFVPFVTFVVNLFAIRNPQSARI